MRWTAFLLGLGAIIGIVSIARADAKPQPDAAGGGARRPNSSSRGFGPCSWTLVCVVMARRSNPRDCGSTPVKLSSPGETTGRRSYPAIPTRACSCRWSGTLMKRSRCPQGQAPRPRGRALAEWVAHGAPWPKGTVPDLGREGRSRPRNTGRFSPFARSRLSRSRPQGGATRRSTLSSSASSRRRG